MPSSAHARSTLGAALVVAGARVGVLLAGVEHGRRQPRSASATGAPRACGSRSARPYRGRRKATRADRACRSARRPSRSRRARRAVRARSGQAAARGLAAQAGEIGEREAQGDLERGGGGEPGAARQVAADLQRALPDRRCRRGRARRRAAHDARQPCDGGGSRGANRSRSPSSRAITSTLSRLLCSGAGASALTVTPSAIANGSASPRL